MKLIQYEPWTALRRFNRDIDHLIANQRDAREHWVPAVDILELDDRFELVVDIPGVDPASLEITAEKGELTLAGERVAAANDEAKQRRIERASGQFQRRFQLPDTADTDSIGADAANGVLTIKVPKKAQLQPRRIDVNVS